MIASTGTSTTATAVTSGNVLAAEVGDCIRRYLADDRDAMTHLVRRVTPYLYKVALGYRLDPHTTEDVVQNTLLSLLQHVGTLKDPACGLAWLSVVARRQALGAIRARRHVDLVGDPDEWGSAVAADDPERDAIANLTRAVLWRNVASLPGRNADLLRMVFLLGMRDYATISGVLDMPVGSIGPTRQRALKKMRGLLSVDPHWGDRG